MISEPIHIISLGAGVQSSTMALMASCGEIKPMPACAVFADTQNEPKNVYHWLEWLKGKLAFPVHVITKGDLWKETQKIRISKKNGLQYWKNWLPTYSLNPDGSKGMFPRKCTYDFKVLPLAQFSRRFANVPRGFKKVMVKQCFGISIYEAHRMKPSRFPFIENIWPLIDAGMTRSMCLQWMKTHGYPKPPKSACIFCPYHSNEVWREMKKTAPEEFAKAVQVEKECNELSSRCSRRAIAEFLHPSRVPLGDIDFGDQPDPQLCLFGNECEGMCGV